MFFVFHMNTEQNINLPHFGGKNKIFQFETPDGLDVTMESEKYGKMHMVEKYSDDGITHVRLPSFVGGFRIFKHLNSRSWR